MLSKSALLKIRSLTRQAASVSRQILDLLEHWKPGTAPSFDLVPAITFKVTLIQKRNLDKSSLVKNAAFFTFYY